MIVSSRTPEGQPGRCPVCGHEAPLLACGPLADAPCPQCGTLIWPIHTPDSLYLLAADILSADQRETLRMLVERARRPDLDSLDQVELMMDLEEAFDVCIPDEVAERLRSVDDIVQYLSSGRGESGLEQPD